MILRLTAQEQRLFRSVSAAMLSPNNYTVERTWSSGILKPLTELIGCQKSGVRQLVASGHQWTECEFDPQAIQAYNTYFGRFDHGRALRGPDVSSHVNSTINRFQDRLPVLFRSEFYCDFLQPFGFLDSIALSTRRTKQESGSTLYVWHDKALDSSDRARRIAILRLLAPAFRSGMQASTQVNSARSAFTALIDRMAEGCAFFSHTAVLLHTNTALTAILAGSTAPDTLRDTIAIAAASVRDTCFSRIGTEPNAAAPAVDVYQSEGTYRISATVFDHSPLQADAAILVSVAFCSATHPSSAVAIRPERYGLTKREVEVVRLLISRQSNREIAHHLGVSLHTARHHTENIMRKLGVASRSDITKVLLVHER